MTSERPRGTIELKRAVENQHGCTATFIQSAPVIVQVFRIDGHPKARRAYAWSSPIEGSDKRRFFAVLHLPPVTSPIEGVRAAIITENRGTV
jgi:hypothetical protein